MLSTRVTQIKESKFRAVKILFLYISFSFRSTNNSFDATQYQIDFEGERNQKQMMKIKVDSIGSSFYNMRARGPGQCKFCLLSKYC